MVHGHAGVDDRRLADVQAGDVHLVPSRGQLDGQVPDVPLLPADHRRVELRQHQDPHASKARARRRSASAAISERWPIRLRRYHHAVVARQVTMPAAPRNPATSPAQPAPQLAEHAAGQHRADVGTLLGGAVRGPDHGDHGGLGDPLGVRAGPQVGPGRAGLGDLVVHARARLEDHPGAGDLLGDADAELGLLGAERDQADPSDLLVEVPDPLEDLAAHGHVAAPQVAHVGAHGRLALVGAADDPVQLRWQVVRTPRWPDRRRDTAHGHDVLVVVRREQLLDPVRFGRGVVVDEGDDRPLGLGDAGVAGSGGAAGAQVVEDAYVGELVASAGQQPVVVVHDQDRLQRRHGLVRQRVHARHDDVPPVHRVGGNDDGDVRPRRPAHRGCPGRPGVAAVAGPGGRPGAELRAGAHGAVGAAAVVLVRVGRMAALAALGPRPAGGQAEQTC